MPTQLHAILADSKAVFARGLNLYPSTPDAAVFNAPRPLLGAELPRNDWLHGRFFVEVNLADLNASEIVKRNNELDARLVISCTDAELIEMMLIGNKYRERYRECAFADQMSMLLPNLSKIQSLPYGEAVSLLDAAQALITADSAP